jgi:hypothetical protein
MKQILQVDIRLRAGRKNGVPAQTIVNILILIVLNRIAEISPI